MFRNSIVNSDLRDPEGKKGIPTAGTTENGRAYRVGGAITNAHPRLQGKKMFAAVTATTVAWLEVIIVLMNGFDSSLGKVNDGAAVGGLVWKYGSMRLIEIRMTSSAKKLGTGSSCRNIPVNYRY
jgi:hypothetical protein